MTTYRVRWKNHHNMKYTYSSEVLNSLEDAQEYLEAIKPYVSSVWVETARWELFIGEN